MPQDIDKYLSDLVVNSGSTALKDKFSHVVLEKDRPSINAPASSSNEPRKYQGTFDNYLAKNKNIENNITILFGDEKTPDGNFIEGWSNRIKNLANYSYMDSLKGLVEKTGKTATTASWKKVHKEAKEILQLMTEFDLVKNKKGELELKALSDSFTQEKWDRFTKLTDNFKTDWDTAVRRLTEYTTKDGSWKRKSESNTHYVYDFRRDKVVTKEDYALNNFDIKPGEDFSAAIKDNDDALNGWKHYLERRNFVPDDVSSKVNEMLVDWGLNTIKGLNAENKAYFKTSTGWAKNRGFADQLVRDLFELGSEKGIGNFTEKHIKSWQKGYEASAGGTKDNPYDIRKQYKWIEENQETIHQLLTSLSPRQAIQLYQRYDTLGVGIHTKPGADEAKAFIPEGKKPEFDEFQNNFSTYIKESWNVKHIFNDLSAEAVREMTENIEAQSPLLVTIPSEALPTIAEYNLFSEKVPEIMKHLIYNFAVDGANNIRTRDEIWKLVQTGSKDELLDEYIDHKIAGVNSSVKTPSWNSKTEEERSKLRSQWASQFENLFSYVNYFRGSQKDTSFAANLYKSIDSYGKDFNSEYDKFYDNYRKKFSALEPQHLYPAASMMGGHRMKGNYSLVTEGIDLQPSEDAVRNEKNQNFLKVIDGAVETLDLDLSQNVFQGEKGSSKDMAHISYQGNSKPNVFVSYGSINFDLDLSDTGQLNDLEGPKGDNYTYDVQKKILDKVLNNRGKDQYNVTYWNTTKNPKYKAYTFTKTNATAAEKKNGTDKITIYLSNERAKATGEKLAIHEYNDQSDFIFDASGTYSVSEFDSLGGKSKIHSGQNRIKDLKIVNIQGAKYAKYNELDVQTGAYSLQKTYLGPTDKLSIDNAVKALKEKLQLYKTKYDDFELNLDNTVTEEVAKNVM